MEVEPRRASPQESKPLGPTVGGVGPLAGLDERSSISSHEPLCRRSARIRPPAGRDPGGSRPDDQLRDGPPSLPRARLARSRRLRDRCRRGAVGTAFGHPDRASGRPAGARPEARPACRVSTRQPPVPLHRHPFPPRVARSDAYRQDRSSDRSPGRARVTLNAVQNGALTGLLAVFGMGLVGAATTRPADGGADAAARRDSVGHLGGDIDRPRREGSARPHRTPHRWEPRRRPRLWPHGGPHPTWKLRR